LQQGIDNEKEVEEFAPLYAWELFKPFAGESVRVWTERMVSWAQARLPDETEQAYADRIMHWLEHKQDDETQEEWVARSKAFQNRHGARFSTEIHTRGDAIGSHACSLEALAGV
jgi:hypothetical protein